MRAREIGVVIGSGIPGSMNAITDVRGVRVGHTTLIEGDGPLIVGQGPIRTGVTVVVPRDGDVWDEPLFAGSHRLNGNGEMTGLEWVRESGLVTSPIGLTTTHSIGAVHEGLIRAEVARRGRGDYWGLPVVAETWDGRLNDINGFHVRPDHVAEALAAAASGAVAEGNVGGGTGMVCHGFKGGIGTASRVVDDEAGGYTVGVLVQANYGRRERLRVNGAAVGDRIPPSEVPLPTPSRATATPPPGAGSIIVVIATDAPLLPHQCRRLAQRAGLGVARMGGAGEHWSGDLFIAFATGNRGIPSSAYGARTPVDAPLSMLADAHITPLFYAVVEATEEAILNALLAAETMTGVDGVTAYGLEADRLLDALG
ncbi:MAG: P1 family peptidase [Candidatus Limnocylindria bacterium]